MILFTAICFLMSLWAIFISRQNLLIIFLAIELMLLCLNFMFICNSIYFDDFLGVIMFFLFLSLAGAEASIALSILVVVYRLRGLISIYILSYLKN
jgi:NADH-quinone oxidoreductase subunit K